MKKNKTLGLTLLASAAMLLAACTAPEPSKSEDKKSNASTPTSQQATSSIESNLPKYDVVIKGADGAEISKEKIELRSPITKPADPAAPAGKVFYGWKNNKNGGQIWDFEAEHELNQVMDDVELEPVFVPAGMNVQTFEAELCPEITLSNGGTGMDGATYSGGAKGKQFVGRTYDGEYGATSVSSIEYYEVYANQDDKEAEVRDSYAELTDTQEAGKIYDRKTKQINYGAVVHFNYNKGNILSFELTSDVAATGVTLFARFSAEYGKMVAGDGFEDTIDSFSDEDFQIKVNGAVMKHGDVAIHNIEGTSGAKYIYCQDYLMGNVDLKAGTNKIEMVVNNDKTLNGTIAASAPVIDSIKLYSSSNLTWPTARYTNLLND